MSEQPTTEEKLLTYKELSERMGVSVSTMRRQIKQCKVPSVVMGHQIVRFHFPTVLKYLHERNRS